MISAKALPAPAPTNVVDLVKVLQESLTASIRHGRSKRGAAGSSRLFDSNAGKAKETRWRPGIRRPARAPKKRKREDPFANQAWD